MPLFGYLCPNIQFAYPMIGYFRAIKQQSPWLQLLLFGALTACSMILANVAGQLLSILVVGFRDHMAALSLLGTPELLQNSDTVIPVGFKAVLVITQISSQIGLFIVPPVIFAVMLSGSGFGEELAVNATPRIFSVLMVIALTGLVLPFVSWLTEINMMVDLPPVFALSEQRAQIIMDLLLNDNSITMFVLNILMIAVIPAIGEEFFFRGIIQKYLAAGLKNIHLAVFITALLFSFFHFQFHGFLPRMLLGILFGYLMVWTGNLWMPVLAHFINNGAAVVVEFLAQRGVIPSGYQDLGQEVTTFTVLFSVAATVLISAAIRYDGKHQGCKREMV